jgi:hypothetical protein
MCRNIKVLLTFEPPASDEEVRAASVQFVRKPHRNREQEAARLKERSARRFVKLS